MEPANAGNVRSNVIGRGELKIALHANGKKMARRRRPNGWQTASIRGRVARDVPNEQPAWELFLQAYGIAPEKAAQSPRARAWAKKFAMRHYVPEKVLKEMGIEVFL